MSNVYFLIESRLRPVQLANCWQSAAKPRHVYIFNGHTYRSAENYDMLFMHAIGEGAAAAAAAAAN